MEERDYSKFADNDEEAGQFLRWLDIQMEEQSQSKTEPRVNPSPFLRKSLPYSIKSKGSPCKKGERSDKTGCVSVSGKTGNSIQNLSESKPPAPKIGPSPFLSHEQQVQALADLYDRSRRDLNAMPNASDFAAYVPPQGMVVLPKVQEAVAKLTKDPYSPPDLYSVYEEANKVIPSLTVKQFQSILGRLHHEGKIKLQPFTRAISTIEYPETVMPISGELMNYVVPVSQQGKSFTIQRKCMEGENKGKPGPCPTGNDIVESTPKLRSNKVGPSPFLSQQEQSRNYYFDLVSRVVPGKLFKKDQLKKITERMTMKALQRLGLSQTIYHPDFEILQEEFDKAGGIPGMHVAGFFDPTNKTIQMNGRETKSEEWQEGIWVHEATHAIDHNGVGEKLSQSSEWKKAWEKEILNGHAPTLYAQTSTLEGFAEFGRLLYHQKHYSLETVEKTYPQCFKFFREQGLV